jgi:hypothetical protein
MRGGIYAVAAALLLCRCELAAQTTETIYLSTQPEFDTVQLKPGRYQFLVVDMVPRFTYRVTISGGTETIPPIRTPFRDSSEVAAVKDCPNLTPPIAAFDSAKTEGDIPALANALQDSIAHPSTTTCSHTAADRLLSKTHHAYDDVFDLAAGDYVIVTIARIDGGATRWQRRYTTGSPGEWRATFGFAFPGFARISHWRSRWDGQRFFTKPIPDTNIYQIATERRTRQFDAVPTVMFAFEPTESLGIHPWLVGLGLDLTNPVLMLGTGFTFKSNLVVSVGGAFRQERVLNGQYAPGDTVPTALTADQLERNEYRLRPYLSVTLRFDKNPFGKTSTTTPSADGQKAGEKKSGSSPAGANRNSYGTPKKSPPSGR